MNKHFSYLLDDVSSDFFQKVACREADEDENVYVPRPEPEIFEKKSSVSSFEKIASRIDRDLGIIKAAGAVGTSFGMCKRAEYYIETVLQQADLEPDELSQIFEKVAAEAIETDMNASWDELSRECPEDLHPWLEWQMSKIGFDIAQHAELEKQAIWSWGVRALSRARAGGAGLARQVAGMPGRTATRAKGIKGHLGASGGARRMKELKADIKMTRAKGPAGTAARKSFAKQYAAQYSRRAKGLKAREVAGAKLPEGKIPSTAADRSFTAKADRRQAAIDRPRTPKAPKPPSSQGKPKGTTAEGAKTTTTKEISEAKKRTSEIEAKKGLEDAKGAAGVGDKPKQHLRENRGSSGKNRKPKTTPPERPPNPTPPAGASEGMKASWKKWKKDGFSSLNAAEKRDIYQGGAMAALAYRGVAGQGAVTGGEGLV